MERLRTAIRLLSVSTEGAIKPGMPPVHQLLKHKPYQPPGMKVFLPGQPLTETERELYYGVHTAKTFQRAAIYANGASSGPEDPPVVLTVDVDHLKAKKDIDAVVTYATTGIVFVLEQIKNVEELAERAAQGDEVAGDELRRAIEREGEQQDTSREEPVSGVGDLVYPSATVGILLDLYTQDDELGKAVLRILGGDMPDEVETEATEQYRYPHEIPFVRIVKVTELYPWRDQPAADTAEEIEEMVERGELKEQGEGHNTNLFDGEGYVVYSLDQLHDLDSYGWDPPVKAVLWEDKQLRLWPVQKVQYHGTSLSKAREIMEGVIG